MTMEARIEPTLLRSDLKERATKAAAKVADKAAARAAAKAAAKAAVSNAGRNRDRQGLSPRCSRRNKQIKRQLQASAISLMQQTWDTSDITKLVRSSSDGPSISLPPAAPLSADSSPASSKSNSPVYSSSHSRKALDRADNTSKSDLLSKENNTPLGESLSSREGGKSRNRIRSCSPNNFAAQTNYKPVYKRRPSRSASDRSMSGSRRLKHRSKSTASRSDLTGQMKGSGKDFESTSTVQAHEKREQEPTESQQRPARSQRNSGKSDDNTINTLLPKSYPHAVENSQSDRSISKTQESVPESSKKRRQSRRKLVRSYSDSMVRCHSSFGTSAERPTTSLAKNQHRTTSKSPTRVPSKARTGRSKTSHRMQRRAASGSPTRAHSDSVSITQELVKSRVPKFNLKNIAKSMSLSSHSTLSTEQSETSQSTSSTNSVHVPPKRYNAPHTSFGKLFNLARLRVDFDKPETTAIDQVGADKDLEALAAESTPSDLVSSENSSSIRNRDSETDDKGGEIKQGNVENDLLSATAGASSSNQGPRKLGRSFMRSTIKKTKKTVTKERNTKVAFGSVGIREYERCVGDNPAVSSGPPICLGWSYLPEQELSVDLFEQYMRRSGPRTRKDFFLTPQRRFHMLLDEWGYSVQAIIKAKDEAAEIRNQRQLTVSGVLGPAPGMAIRQNSSVVVQLPSPPPTTRLSPPPPRGSGLVAPPPRPLIYEKRQKKKKSTMKGKIYPSDFSAPQAQDPNVRAVDYVY